MMSLVVTYYPHLPPVGHGIRRNLNATNILYRVDALRRSHRTEASNLFDVAEYLQHLATDYFSYAVVVYVYAQNLGATGHAALSEARKQVFLSCSLTRDCKKGI